MKLGEVIRKYRKEKQMTQEEMAGYLGVSAPAVNKWENGNSFPDITLLAPIARLLGIRTDTLLSYEENLSLQEIRRILTQLGEMVKEESFDAAFQWAAKQIREYPNCESLILGIAQTLEGYQILIHPDNDTVYNETIEKYYIRARDSQEAVIRQEARMALAQHYLLQEKFTQAQEMLNEAEVSQTVVQKNRMQALLYKKQGEKEKAYELYEKILFTGSTDIFWALQGLAGLAAEESDRKRAWELVKKQEELADILEMGEWMKVSPGLGLAIEEKDKEACLSILEKIIPEAGNIDAFRGSELYRHVRFNESDQSDILFMLKKSFEDDESIDFLRGEARFQALIEGLERLNEKRMRR